MCHHYYYYVNSTNCFSGVTLIKNCRLPNPIVQGIKYMYNNSECKKKKCGLLIAIL